MNDPANAVPTMKTLLTHPCAKEPLGTSAGGPPGPGAGEGPAEGPGERAVGASDEGDGDGPEMGDGVGDAGAGVGETTGVGEGVGGATGDTVGAATGETVGVATGAWAMHEVAKRANNMNNLHTVAETIFRCRVGDYVKETRRECSELLFQEERSSLNYLSEWGHNTRIDYLLMRRGDLRACKDFRVFPGDACSSQHRLLALDTLFERQRDRREATGMLRILWKKLNGQVIEVFRAVSEGLFARSKDLNVKDANQMWSTLPASLKTREIPDDPQGILLPRIWELGNLRYIKDDGGQSTVNEEDIKKDRENISPLISMRSVP
ncbi:hypothetical protein CTI12_AA530870 [Artemisia annua]|uniref:Uncharacterized protein n=1 Tax=Artemisia annua TaxID=35608 RepID=A0A2U1L4V0_ARTAN|nr:hypothetical protein CTI12_AA530870 [Artemisia annua]